MKTKNAFLGSFILGIGLALTGCASTEDFHDESLDEFRQLNSMGHHAQILESPEARIGRLEDKIINLQEQIAIFNKKEYFDPHEFRLSGWEILKGDYQKQVDELREQIFDLKNTLSQHEGLGKMSGTVLIEIA